MKIQVIVFGLLLLGGCVPDEYKTGTCVSVYEQQDGLYYIRAKVSNELIRINFNTLNVRVFDDVKAGEPMWYQGSNSTFPTGWSYAEIHVHNAGDIRVQKLEKTDND